MAVMTKEVQIPGGTPGLNGYLVEPEGAGPFPALLIIHEIFGLNDDIRGIARRFAEQGYAALAVDLFAGRNRMVCMARFMSGIILNSLHNGAIHDMNISLNYFQTLPEVDGKRVGAAGFCMGGSFVIAWACTDDRLKAIAPFYAMNPRPLEAVKRLCPVVGSYPDGDFTAGAGRKLDEALDGYKIEHDIKIYPDSIHSFFNEARREAKSGNAAAADDSWDRMLAFFGEHLR